MRAGSPRLEAARALSRCGRECERLRQRAELRGREPLGAHVGRMAELQQRRAGAIAHVRALAGAQRERARQRLAAVGEGGAHEGADLGRGRRAGALQDDEHGVDVGHRVEDGARDRAVHAHVARELGEHAGHAVGRRARRGGEALADLALDHRHPARDAVELLDGAQDRARRDPVGEVGDDLGRRGRERAEVEVERVGDVQRRVRMGRERVLERGHERAVELDDVDVGRVGGQVLAEHAQAAADLEHDVGAGSSSAARSMTPRMFESMRKFWPRSRLGRTPNWRRRRRLGWVGSSPVTTRRGWQRWRRPGARAPRRRRRGARRRSARCARRRRAGCAPCARAAA